MEGELERAMPPLGLLLVQGGCLPTQLRSFLEADQVGGSSDTSETPSETIAFRVLRSDRLGAAVTEGSIDLPSLWIDEQEAGAGVAALQVVYSLGGPPLAHRLALKPLRLQPIRKGAASAAAYRAFLSAKPHLQLYRLVHTLFPVLQRWDADLRSGGVVMADTDAPLSVGQVRAKPEDGGLLLEVHSAATGVTARGRVTVNFRLACVEVQDLSDEASTQTPRTARCLRSANSLEEAIAALRHGAASSTAEPAAAAAGPSGSSGFSTPSTSPRKLGLAAVGSLATGLRAILSFQSPSKPPRRAAQATEAVTEGVELVQACSSAQLRDGATMLQAAAAEPGGAEAAVEAGAMEALVAAAATVLPSNVMGTTEQLTLLVLTVTAILDGDEGSGVVRLVAALSESLASACANPVLLCKLLVALLQRADVRLEAVQQGLWATLSEAYLRKSPLLEPLAAALLSPGSAAAAAAGTRLMSPLGKSREGSPSEGSPAAALRAAGPTSPAGPGGRLGVPRLCLPGGESDAQVGTPTGGLTRATRRELSATPTEWHPPSLPWGSPRSYSAAKDASAASEMDAMAEALGESLMAIDLPSLVAHKRRADAVTRDSESDAGSIPAELLEGPATTARQQTLQAHAIFTTARSLKSLDSSSVRSAASVDSQGQGTDPSADVGGDGDVPSAAGVADVAEVKTLMLAAMAAALPLPGATAAPAADPAPILAAEVLAMSTSGLTPQQETLRTSCLQLLAKIALRRGTPSGHVFLAAVGAKLAQMAATGALTAAPTAVQAAHLLHTAAEYLALVDAPSASEAVAQHCLGPITAVLVALEAAGPSPERWSADCWRLLHGALAALTPTLALCDDPEAGRALIAGVMGDYRVAVMLVAVADLALLRADEPSAAPALAAARTARLPALQRDLLAAFGALACLLARQKALSPGLDPGDDALVILEPQGRGQRRRLTRRHALNFFSFLVCPSSEFVRRVLDHAGPGASAPTAAPATASPGPAPPLPLTSSAIRLRPGVFELLRTLFAAPGSPFIADKAVADHYVRFHFIQFLKLYHNPQRDHQAPFLCRQHMGVLLALAGAGAPHLRHRFQQLSVVDFFVRELSLEFEASQPGGGRLGPSESSASGLDLLGVSGRPGSAGKLQSGFKKGSPAAGSDGNVTPLHQQSGTGPRHKRGRSQSGVPLLPLAGRKDTAAGSPWSTPSPPVPKLRLPGSGSRPAADSPADSPQGSAQDSSRRLSFSRGASSRRGSPRTTSRLGREAAAQAAAAAAAQVAAEEGGGDGSGRPAVPRLGLGGLGLSMGGADEASSPSSGAAGADVDSDDEEMDRIAAGPAAGLAAVPAAVPPLQLHGRLAGGAPGAGGSGSGRPLDRSISAAISLDKGWLPSARTAAAATAAAGGSDRGEETVVPSGFVFSGDLDEDVERLEALERGDEEEGSDADDSSSASSSSGGDGPSARAAVLRPPALNLGGLSLGPPPLELTPDADEGLGPAETATFAASAVPRLMVPPKASPVGAPAARLPDSPPPRPVPPPVPRLAITPSMHSTLEARMASAELQAALEAEHSRRQAGRSFFGDLERRALGKGKMQAATLVRRGSRSSTDALGAGGGTPLASAATGDVEVSYAEERARRLVYRDAELHLQVLVLVFTLILEPRGQLDPGYCDQYPWDRRLQNIPFLLHHHLNHRDNRGLLPRLLPALQGVGAPALRLLRTLCAAFFRPAWYARRARISGVAGAYATVYRCALPSWAGTGASAVLKLLDTPRHVQDRCAQVDFHSEVTILDTLAGRRSACQMYDFGLDPGADALLLVLKDYRCSLKQWRAAQPEDPTAQLRLYYAVFREVVVAVGQLLDSGVIHFDLKCDNVLLEPLPGCREAEFWAPPSSTPPFRVVLADFGESKLADVAGEPAAAAAVAAAAPAGGGAGAGAVTSRARGTDAFKSPEMLLVGGAVHKGHRAYDRRRRQGAGAASDVWSLGCLLYELVTGRLLFSDTDWLQLVARVTSANMQLITDERAAAVAGLPGVLDLLQYILVRDPALRPTLKDTLTRLDAAMAAYGGDLPPHRSGGSASARRPPPPPADAPPPPPAASSGSLASSMHVDEEPLPLVVPLPVLPGLVVGPAAGVTRRMLREASVGRVVVITDHCGGPLASEISEADVLGEEALAGCFEAAAAVGAAAVALAGPSDWEGADAVVVVAWAESALSRLASLSDGRAVLLAPQPGREGAAALLTVAAAVASEPGCTPYRAMVRASHWGLDLHMGEVHLEALKAMGEQRRRRGIGR